MPTPFSIGGVMRLKQRYKESLRLKREINRKLREGTDFPQIRELMLFLAKEQSYVKLKREEEQLIMLESFLNIWLKEKRKLPELGMASDIFCGITCLDDLERKYRRIKYCGLRIENNIPEEFIQEAVQWMDEEKVSGLAIGKIMISQTKRSEQNILFMAKYMKKRGDMLNAFLLLQYANEALPDREKLLLEEADIWVSLCEWEKALKLLERIKEPAQDIRGLMTELEGLRQVAGNDRQT